MSTETGSLPVPRYSYPDKTTAFVPNFEGTPIEYKKTPKTKWPKRPVVFLPLSTPIWVAGGKAHV